MRQSKQILMRLIKISILPDTCSKIKCPPVPLIKPSVTAINECRSLYTSVSWMITNNLMSLIHYSQILSIETLFIFGVTQPMKFKTINTPSLTNTPTDWGADLLLSVQLIKTGEVEQSICLDFGIFCSCFFFFLKSRRTIFHVSQGKGICKTCFCSSRIIHYSYYS